MQNKSINCSNCFNTSMPILSSDKDSSETKKYIKKLKRSDNLYSTSLNADSCGIDYDKNEEKYLKQIALLEGNSQGTNLVSCQKDLCMHTAYNIVFYNNICIYM